MLTRRTFLQTAALAAAAPAAQPKRIAILAAAYPQHMADRFLVGYPYDGAWHKSDMRVVSLYVENKTEPGRATEFGFQVYPTVSDALRCGGTQLAVDAVLSFGFLAECIQVFEQDGRAVPVFQDGPLSPSFEKAKAMIDASRRLRFPLLAGSSLPVTWRLPAIDLPPGCGIEEALMVGVGDAMDFPALEGLQCMVERRRGGETGVKAVQMLEGDAVWRAQDEGRYSKTLLTAALSRSDTPLGLTVDDGRTQDLVASSELRNLAKKPVAYFLEYRDGLHATLLMLDGALKDFMAVRGASHRHAPNPIHPVPVDSRTECRLLRLPDAQSGRDVRERRGALPGGAHAPGQRHARKLPYVEITGPRPARDSALECRLQGAPCVPVRAGVT